MKFSLKRFIVLLTAFLSYSSCYSCTTIEIFRELLDKNSSCASVKPSHLEEKEKEKEEERINLDKSPYNESFGYESIFKYHETSFYQKNVMSELERFENLIEEKGVAQNFIIVGVRVGNYDAFIQHMFFSGNVETIHKNIFLNIQDLKEQLGVTKNDSEKTTSVTSRNFGQPRTSIRKLFFFGEQPSNLGKDITLECLVSECFPRLFLNPGEADFFMFPVHQANFMISKNISDSHNPKPEYPDMITCEFREFIYSYFINPSNFSLTKGQEDLLSIIRNITNHANHHISSSSIYPIQEKILRASFMELYVRNDKAAQAILGSIFGIQNFDDVFGPLEKKSGQKGKSEDRPEISNMSNCFQHSEQAFLKAIRRNGISIREFILGYLFTIYKEDVWLSPTNESSPNVPVALNEDEIHSRKDEEIGKDKLEDESAKSDTNQISLNLVIPITLDIYSPRHICRYCRGSISLRYSELEKLFKEITLEKVDWSIKRGQGKSKQSYIDVVLKECENKKIKEKIIKLKKDKDFGYLTLLYNFLIKKTEKSVEVKNFILNYQSHMIFSSLEEKYGNLAKKITIILPKIDFHIYATSLKSTKDSIM